MNTNQERINNVRKSKVKVNEHKIVKIVIHLENGEQEVIRRGIDKNLEGWLGIIKPLLIAAYCRMIQELNLSAKQAA